MLLSKEYVGYLAREVTKKLIAGGHIETKAVPAVTEPIRKRCAGPAPTIRRCFAR